MAAIGGRAWQEELLAREERRVMREEQMRQMVAVQQMGNPYWPERGDPSRAQLAGCGAGGLGRAIEESIRLRQVEEEYGRYGIEPPKELARQRKEGAELVKRLDREEKKRRLAEAERLVEELKSKEEKRKAAEVEVERLRRELGES